MELKQCLLTKSDCYKYSATIKPVGIVVHSTGANNPNLRRYVQPDDGLLGVNKYNNSWNRPGLNVGVHCFIGKDKNGDVRCYQTLPFNKAAWGVGSGKKGSYNYNPTGHIQFEICEDGLTDEDYFNKAFDLAAELCAYLCKEFNLSVDSIVGHHEAYLKGYGSNHSDPENWTKKFGKDMNWFRSKVREKLEPEEEWKPGKYKLLYTKSVRKSPNLGLNEFRVWELAKLPERWGKSDYALLVSTNKNAKAKLSYYCPEKPTILDIVSIVKENGRVWGKWGNYGNDWVCLCNADGTPQAKKI